MTSVVERFAASSALFAAITLLSQNPPPSGAAAERVAPRLRTGIQQSLHFVPDPMAHYHVLGLSLACIHRGYVEWKAFGIVKLGGTPGTPETLFQVEFHRHAAAAAHGAQYISTLTTTPLPQELVSLAAMPHYKYGKAIEEKACTPIPRWP